MPTQTEHKPSLSPKTFSAVRPEELEFADFPAFPQGAEQATVVGDITQPGPFVIRVHLPAGTKMMPHAHREDRIYTVISGVFYIGHGERFDEAGLVAYAPGSVVVLPANTPHFHWAKSGDYVAQVYAFGPLGTHYINPKDDPRNQ